MIKMDVRTWYPCLTNKRTVLAPEYELSLNGALPRDIVPGKYKLGIWMPDDGNHNRGRHVGHLDPVFKEPLKVLCKGL